MNGIKRENLFIVMWFCFTLLLIGVCNLGFIRGTWAGFGNITGQLTPSYTIEYLSNYPGELGLGERTKIESVVYKDYVIKENNFILDGYEFVSWNTSSDGLGDTYLVNDNITLEKSITLYAQWKKIDTVMVSYGDININGKIDEDDYILLEKYIDNVNTLDEQALLNADVNVDGKIDLVDVDIIKQAYLGTDDYVGYLPEKPILKYEIYVSLEEDDSLGDQENSNGGNDSNKPTEGDGSIDKPSVDEDTTLDNDNNKPETGTDDSGGSSGSVGTGGGSNGSGSSSSGTGNSGSQSSNGGNKKPSSSTGSSNAGNQSGSVSTNNDDKNDGGSTDKKDDNVNNENIEIDKEEDSLIVENNNEDEETSYVYFIVFVICLIAIRLIIYVVEKFKEKEIISKLE